MSKAYSIRQLRMEGDSIAEISRKLEVSRDTVYKYLAMENLSQRPPAPRAKASVLDRYRPLIESWLAEHERNWRKQRHTARRIWARLRDEAGADVAGVRTRMSFFVMTFPYSNVGIAQVFPGENAECVCQALRNIFEHVAGVPRRIVFDNAAGVGRRVGDAVRTTEMFSAFAAHYGFAFSFCNPYSGHEKGSVEKKVGYIRDNLFVPLPQIASADAFNARLLDRSMALSDKAHWIKGENELQLFVEDRFAMMGLPPAPFSVVRYEVRKADKLGKVRVGGPHLYSAGPSLAGRELVCGIGATTVTIATRDGAVVAEHRRAYGDAPTDTADPASQLALLCQRPGAWANSKVRSAIPDDLRGHMDSLGRSDLKAELRLMRDQAAASGWDATVQAMAGALLATGRIDRASVAVGAARIAGGAVEYDEPVDLSAYDEAFSPAGR